MTKAYEQLKEGPRTGLNAQLAPDERAELRRLKVRGVKGHAWKGTPGKLTTVYYLAGDEARAARRFVEENREQLERMQFDRKNPLSESLSRELYDLVLHHLGKRRRRVYDSLVVEERQDGTRWFIDRERYDKQPNRRYGIGEPGTARVSPDVDLEALFEAADEIITQSTVRNWPVDGDARQVLDYLRHAPDFLCEPTTSEEADELAVRKTE